MQIRGGGINRFDLEADPLELRSPYGESRHRREVERLSRAIASRRDPEISTKPHQTRDVPHAHLILGAGRGMEIQGRAPGTERPVRCRCVRGART